MARLLKKVSEQEKTLLNIVKTLKPEEEKQLEKKIVKEFETYLDNEIENANIDDDIVEIFFKDNFYNEKESILDYIEEFVSDEDFNLIEKYDTTDLENVIDYLQEKLYDKLEKIADEKVEEYLSGESDPGDISDKDFL